MHCEEVRESALHVIVSCAVSSTGIIELHAPKSRDFCDYGCKFPLWAGNPFDFRHLSNKEGLELKGANVNR